MVQRPRPNGLIIPHRLPWPKRLLAALVYGLIRVVSATLRWEFQDRSGLFQREPVQPALFCIWHNRLAMSLMIHPKHPRRLQPSRRLAAIVSASRDGALLARILELFGVQPVRGSSSRRGPQALLELTTWAERGYDIAFTPDGPRGPCYVVQDGVIVLAQVTGFPIVPVTCRLSWKIQVKSWDRFQIPLPFSQCVVCFGEPVCVSREAGEQERADLRRKVEQALQE